MSGQTKTLTTYTDSALSDTVKGFLNRFTNRDKQYRYVDDIDTMMPTNSTSVSVDFTDFASDCPDIEDMFRREPDRILDAFARATKEVLQVRYPDYAERIKDEITVRISNYPLKKSVREINSKSSGKFISIKAMLIRMSAVESIPRIAVYVCPDDHQTTATAKKNFNIGAPIICSNSNCKHRDFELKQNASTFVDYQILQLQELSHELPAGKLPKTLGVFVSGNLVDSARMGDTVEISGIVRAELSNEIKLGTKVQTYRQRLYANNIMRLSGDNDLDGTAIGPKDQQTIQSIRNMSEDNATQYIVNSFATHIHGHSIIKEALILQMIGSDAQILDDGTRVRGDINIFLVGDPGTAKSEMGKSVHRSAPRGFYASGRGSSGVGLTAATIQDKVTGAFMLEPGVTVLADKGLAVIDEFDKMRPEDRSALHEVMEQQSVSVSKGGITATLNARASILAIANPVYGRYDPFKNLTDNIPSIPIPLLTRFDMIFVVRDLPSREKDEKIARHIISTHKSNTTPRVSKSFDSDIFKKYLRLAKRIRPKLSKTAEEKIIQYYLKMRNSGSNNNNSDEDSGFTITPRQLEGLIRLTTARAKFLLKDNADEHDADRAIYLLEKMFASSGVDVNTGKVDIGVFQGTPASEVSKIQIFQDIMRNLTVDNRLGVTKKEIIKNMTDSGKWNEDTAEAMIARGQRDSIIYESSPGLYALIH